MEIFVCKCSGQLCKLNETTGKITYSKNFGSSSGWWWRTSWTVSLRFWKGQNKNIRFSASDPGSSSSSKLCTYGNTNNKAKLGYYLSNPYVTRNGAGEITEAVLIWFFIDTMIGQEELKEDFINLI